MRCPYCHETEDRVVDSRTSREGAAIRRRRECINCGKRFTTYEYVEQRPLQVIKSDGNVEPYERKKLLRSLRLPCVKRPITAGEIEAIVDGIEDELSRLGSEEIDSRAIGELAAEALKARDHVAYVRFASVYRDFKDIDEFVDELEALSARRARAAESESQVELPL
jgi:transcriptional repressor NrdR